MSFCHCFCLISSVRRVGLRKIAVLWDQYDPDTSLALSKNLYQAKSHLQKESSGSYNHCAVWAFTSPLKRNNCICNEFIWLFKKTHPSALNGSYHTRNHSHCCRMKNFKIMSPVFHVWVRQCSLDFPTVNFNTACHLLPPHVYWCSWEEFLWRLTAVQPVIAGQGTFTRVHKGSSVNIFRLA